MNSKKKEKISVQTTVKGDVKKIWDLWTKPEHITNWNFASEEWCCPRAINNLESNGELNWRMEAKDESLGFDFIGTYDKISPHELITYHIEDGRMVEIEFKSNGEEVTIKETFEAEGTNLDEMQKKGWQAILGNFKVYAESQ